MIENNENYKICKKCGGECCKSMGCAFSVNDFKEELSYNLIKEILETGLVSIDNYFGDPITESTKNWGQVYYLRIRNFTYKGEGTIPGPLLDDSYFGICCLLGEENCKLEFHQRPYQAQDLVPGVPKCTSEFGKRNCAIEWLPYQDILNQIVNEICNNEFDVDFDLDTLKDASISKERINMLLNLLKEDKR